MRVYEIDTWVWLDELRRRYRAPLKLDSVPDCEWEELAAYPFDAIWLMGIWQRSPQGLEKARLAAGLIHDCAVLGFEQTDIGCSPYCVGRYEVDENFGGRQGLAAVRRKLQRHGLKLILDFVPNHSALDHPWLTSQPTLYVQGSGDDRANPRAFFTSATGELIAFGSPESPARDSHAWDDTAQLNAFSPAYRDTAVATLVDIGAQCDGVRCDMAHLLLSELFSRTWNRDRDRVGRTPDEEFWTDVIGRVRRHHPAMVFIAEAYGLGIERALIPQGFDYCYDKDPFYDHLTRGNAKDVRGHLLGNSDGQPPILEHLIHFMTNHDEESASARFSPSARQRVAAAIIATIPGASLWYCDQFDERWPKHPVQLRRRTSYRDYYRRLLQVTHRPALRHGTWRLCDLTHSTTMLAWCWTLGEERILVVANLSDNVAPWGRVAMPLDDLRGRRWKMRNLWTGQVVWSDKRGEELCEGIDVEPQPWWADIFEILEDRAG